jgi:hypothetical protein
LGEVAFTKNEMDSLRMEGVIAMTKQEIETLELEEKAVKSPFLVHFSCPLTPNKIYVIRKLSLML